MDAFQLFVTKTVPKYLASLPIPKDLEGFSKLTSDQWLQLAPLFFFQLFLLLTIKDMFFPKATRLNTTVELVGTSHRIVMVADVSSMLWRALIHQLFHSFINLRRIKIRLCTRTLDPREVKRRKCSAVAGSQRRCVLS